MECIRTQNHINIHHLASRFDSHSIEVQITCIKHASHGHIQDNNTTQLFVSLVPGHKVTTVTVETQVQFKKTSFKEAKVEKRAQEKAYDFYTTMTAMLNKAILKKQNKRIISPDWSSLPMGINMDYMVLTILGYMTMVNLTLLVIQWL